MIHPVNGHGEMTPRVDEPVIAPPPTGELSNYLILYAYPDGRVQFHCSNLDPSLTFKMLAIASDALSNAAKQMQEDAMKQDKKIIRMPRHV